MKKVSLVNCDKFEDTNGVLCVYECNKQVPFQIKRIFTVTGRVGCVRGNHAHKECSQLLLCVSGSIKVRCDDGEFVTEYHLKNDGEGLLIPPNIWATQEYMENDSVLIVLCDRLYEEEDYIREFDAFRSRI